MVYEIVVLGVILCQRPFYDFLILESWVVKITGANEGMQGNLQKVSKFYLKL